MTAERPDAMEAMAELLEVMARLRAECPWTQQQDHESLTRYLIEEAYEAVEAIDSGDAEAVRDELGDVLMQVVFHAAIADSEEEGWSFADVARAITQKLVQRSPHVFADRSAVSAEDVDAIWQEVKAKDRGVRTSLVGGESTLPALLLAQKVLGRTAPPTSDDDWGSRALKLVVEANDRGLDAEAHLRAAVRAHAETASTGEAEA